MPRLRLSSRPATTADIQTIIGISRRVQDRLEEDGSLQVSGPLSSTHILDRIREQRCVVTCKEDGQIVGLSMVKPIEANYYEQSRDFDVENFPPPWKLLHSFMLEPDLWGKGYGTQFFTDTVDFVEITRCAGTLLLDCWAGNEKLKEFYLSCGCLYMGTVPEDDFHVSVFARFLGPGPARDSAAVAWEQQQHWQPVANGAANGISGSVDGVNHVSEAADVQKD